LLFQKDPPLEELPGEDDDWICPVCTEQKRLHDLREQENRDTLIMSGSKTNPQRQTLLDEHFDIREARQKVS